MGLFVWGKAGVGIGACVFGLLAPVGSYLDGLD